MTLEVLNTRVHQDLAWLAYGGETWVPPLTRPAGHVYDVVIIGGGQSGLGSAFGLLRERISNILVIDENPQGFEGPWDTYARMQTLRSPKHLTAIDFGVPSLTFRAYYEACHGAQAWESLDKAARLDWMAYLRWYREVLNLPVQNDTRLLKIEPKAGLYHLQTSQGLLLSRKVILATGIQGGGEWHVPDFISRSVPRHLYAHTSESLDFETLKGKKIAILGAGASAFDNAHHALSKGVAEAHVYVRRARLPTVNPIRQMEVSGMIARFTALSDSDKYAVMSAFFERNQPPTNDMFERASGFPGFSLHLGSPWQALEASSKGVKITTPHGQDLFDFLIVSTGLVTDPALRPELEDLAPDILRWSDRYSPPDAIKNPLIDAHPYLSEGFGFLGRDAESSQKLRGVFAFNYSGLISFGLSASALSGLRFALTNLIKTVADQLFQDSRDQLLADYYAYAEPEFTAVWPR